MAPDELREVLKADVVIADASAPSLPMDDHVNLFAEERECAAMVEWWTKRQVRVKKAIADLMGQFTVGTVGGEVAVRFEPQDRFNSGEFKKQYPDMYHAYSRPVTETKFDVDALKRTRPDLYNRFQVRPMKVTYKEPGS